MFSIREVSGLGWAFLVAGFLTLLIPQGWFIGPRAMMAVTFGGFHIVYGLWMGYKYGW
jgi:energy-converting hydrogenase Eha subunit G